MPDFFDRNGAQPAGTGVKLSCTASSQTVTLSPNSGGKDYPAKFRVVVANPATAKLVFFKFGVGSQTAATDGTSLAMLVNSTEILRLPPNATDMGYIADAGTADIYLMPINGD